MDEQQDVGREMAGGSRRVDHGTGGADRVEEAQSSRGFSPGAILKWVIIAVIVLAIVVAVVGVLLDGF